MLEAADVLTCPAGHRYPIVDGIPIMLLAEVEQTHPEAVRALDVEVARAELKWDDGKSDPVVDPVVQAVIGATCGHLFSPHRGNLKSYPIPELRLPPAGPGTVLLDVGCSWGRWSVAAAAKGYRVIGLDPSFGSLVVARKVCRQLGVGVAFVAGDARFPPFRDHSLDVVFSYSVLQHFSKENVRAALPRLARLLTADGVAMIQMPNALGLRCLFHQLRRPFRPPQRFDVRYWTLSELRRAFTHDIGPTTVVVDGFFGLGVQPANIDIYTRGHRIVVRLSEVLRKVSHRVRWAAYLADSLYVVSRAAEEQT